MEAKDWVKSKYPEVQSLQTAIFKAMLFGRGRGRRVGFNGIVERTNDVDIKMMENFWRPNPGIDSADIVYGLDVQALENSVDLHLPDAVTRQLHYDKTLVVPAANVTPKYTCVDIHTGNKPRFD